MKIAVVRERTDGETRVAATPETVGKLIALGAAVAVEKGAGEASRIPDADYRAAGADIAAAAGLDAASAAAGSTTDTLRPAEHRRRSDSFASSTKMPRGKRCR